MTRQLFMFGNTDIFSSIGIDWKILLVQIVAFLVLLVILYKWVYPPMLDMLDKREKALRDSAKAAREIQKQADELETKTAALLKQARDEAGDIVVTAQEEASSIVDMAQKKAEVKADALMKSMREEMAREVKLAKNELYNETLGLVATATGTILEQKVTSNNDMKLIEKAIEEAK